LRDQERERLSEGADVTADDIEQTAAALAAFDERLGAAANAQDYESE
jgi:hypothetical protein